MLSPDASEANEGCRRDAVAHEFLRRPRLHSRAAVDNLASDGKDAPLYKLLVEETKLAPAVSAFQGSSEVAGTFRIRIQAFPGTDLRDVEAAIFAALTRFEDEGFTEADLARIKAQTETAFYNGISSVLGKSFQLALYNEFAGSADYIAQDVQIV